MYRKMVYIMLSVIIFGYRTIFAQQKVDRSVISNGGIITNNADYKLNSTLGQANIGLGISSEHQNFSGFWYQINSLITGVDSYSKNFPNKFMLIQNYPNPFNPSTTINYSIPAVISNERSDVRNMDDSKVSPSGESDNVDVTLKIYDVLGREVTKLVNLKQKPGNYEVQWDASDQTSGVYFYKLSAENYTEVKKMILLR